MAGDAEKKAARRKQAAIQHWSMITGGLTAVSLLAHLVVFSEPLSGSQQSALFLQTVLQLVCVYFIGSFAASAEEGHGSALQKGASGKGPAAGDSWKDLVYVIGFSQILSLVSSWGWTAFWALVPAYGAYMAWGTVSGLIKQVKSMMPDITPEQFEGKKDDKAELARQNAAEKKKQEKKEAAMKRKMMIAQKMGVR